MERGGEIVIISYELLLIFNFFRLNGSVYRQLLRIKEVLKFDGLSVVTRTNFRMTRKISLSVKIGLNDRKWSIRPLRNFADLSYMKDAETDNDFFTHGLKVAKFQHMHYVLQGNVVNSSCQPTLRLGTDV